MVSITVITSVLRETDVKELYIEYNIPKEIVFRVFAKKDRACLPLEGFATIYEAHLRSGLCIPVPDELLEIFHDSSGSYHIVSRECRGYLCTFCIFLCQHSKWLTVAMVRVFFKFNQGI
ncbi:hypothetical protein Nepgr_032121 [Nepenthes gracilis]|uniref:Uncharacterized protein n=1 Tax=Nepenthes gracilis TaxID=150966 RepID=A0AAD3TJV8_NEPGR|nr:hypothetical protein Nepgr_032121 [Nepenthes gracilis]